MKKLLLFVMAGVVAFGTAFAEPKNGKPKTQPKTPAEKEAAREKMCRSKPDVYVWVEKDRRCVEKIACMSGFESTHTNYCVGRRMNGFNNIAPLPTEESRYRPILEKYAKYYMNTTPEWIALEYAGGESWLTMYTVDGDYRVFPTYNDRGEQMAIDSVTMAAWAVGLDVHYHDTDDDYLKKFDIVDGKRSVSESLCAEVAEFSTFLNKTQITSKYEDGKCTIIEM